MTKRDHIPLKKQLAAALCQMLRPRPDGTWERIIPHEDAKQMTADQIISLFHLDHWPIRKELGGPDEPWNLLHRPILEHRAKSAKKDMPEIAKSRRLTPAHEEFRRKMLAKAGQSLPEPKAVTATKMRSRPMPFGRESALKKTMSGKIERRTHRHQEINDGD